MLRIKDEETAQDFLMASSRIRQMRRSMRIRKAGLFQNSYKEDGDGSQTEIKDTLAQEEHIKRMPTGQMEMLTPDKIRGVVHQHVHIRQPFRHWLADVPENLYPKLVSYTDRVEWSQSSLFESGAGGKANTAREEKELIVMKMRAIICIAMLNPVLVFGQVGGNRPRSSYDPAAQAGTMGQQQSGVATALQKVNPEDKDYGAAIEQGRIAALEQTVEDFYWWYCVVSTGVLFLLVMYVMWLSRERELRLKVSADIVSQLYNSYVSARAKALDAIEAHNNLANRYNAKLSEIAVMREARTNKEGTPAAKRVWKRLRSSAPRDRS